jgi:hypothetical protein
MARNLVAAFYQGIGWQVICRMTLEGRAGQEGFKPGLAVQPRKSLGLC